MAEVAIKKTFDQGRPAERVEYVGETEFEKTVVGLTRNAVATAKEAKADTLVLKRSVMSLHHNSKHRQEQFDAFKGQLEQGAERFAKVDKDITEMRVVMTANQDEVRSQLIEPLGAFPELVNDLSGMVRTAKRIVKVLAFLAPLLAAGAWLAEYWSALIK